MAMVVAKDGFGICMHVLVQYWSPENILIIRHHPKLERLIGGRIS